MSSDLQARNVMVSYDGIVAVDDVSLTVARGQIVTVVGANGAGKTTLLNRLLDWLHGQRVATAFIFNSQLSVNQLFDFIVAEFEIPCESREKSSFAGPERRNSGGIAQEKRLRGESSSFTERDCTGTSSWRPGGPGCRRSADATCFSNSAEPPD